MNRILIALGVLIVAVIVLTFTLQQRGQSNPDELTIVTTFYPVTNLTEGVAGDAATVLQLVPSGQGPHDYRPTPSDIKTLQSADLIIRNGAGLEDEWLDTLLASTGRTDLASIDLASSLERFGVDLLQLDDEAESAGIHTDPHIWTSPANALVMVGIIRDKLIELDLTHEATYTSQADALEDELIGLDSEIKQRVATWRTRQFIAFHDAFSYFSRDYGLEQVAAVELTPGEAPSPGQLADIQRLVRQNKLKALFAEPQFSSKVVEQLASDLGIDVLVLDPLETNESGLSYVELMRQNVDSLEQALK